jgi:TatD DNase family protein
MIDSHCHLADDVFAPDAPAVIERARAAGLQGALCIVDAGSAIEQERAAGLRRLWPALSFGIGVHPHQAGTWANRAPEALATLAAALDAPAAACAVGEIGLDYHYDFSPREVQREMFAGQLALAIARDLPVIVHAREADDDTVAILREAGPGQVRGVMHCFTGSQAFARQCLDLGMHVSLAGIVTFPKADDLRDVAMLIPDDRILVETDSPFLAPVPHRGKRNEPAWVVEVAARLADVRRVPRETLAAQTTSNYRRLFRPPGLPVASSRLDRAESC